jgi:hypothetical protein
VPTIFSFPSLEIKFDSNMEIGTVDRRITISTGDETR